MYMYGNNNNNSNVAMKNEWIQIDEQTIGILLRWKKDTILTLVDVDVFWEKIASIPTTWVAKDMGKTGIPYVVAGKNQIFLHRLIMDAPSGMVVDHIFHNPLENRKTFLRICTHRENMQNRKPKKENSTPQHRGVHVQKNGIFRAEITVYGKKKALGKFITLSEAVKARKEAEKKYYSDWKYSTFLEAREKKNIL